MKNLIRISFAGVLAATCATASAMTAIQPEDWWENQTVFAVNKEKARATHVPYSSVASLKADAGYYNRPWEDSKSDLHKKLNGNWKFFFVEKPADRPMDFYKTGFDSSDWDVIPVPSCWEMQGYDTPMYVNVNHPWDTSQCPKILKRWDNNGEYAENPVGSYLTEFTVPSDWKDKEIFLNFEGIYSAAYVWVNGNFVGYTQAANTNHEFDVTAYCKEGSNSLAVQVIKWSDGSYLEGQDMFRWGGIFRDVTLTAVPKTFVRDHYITWSTNEAGGYTSGTLSVDLEIENRGSSAANVVADVTLLDAAGNVIAELPSQTVDHLVGSDSKTVRTTAALSGVNLWSCESPYLYTILVSLKEVSGKELEAFSTKYGFRCIEQKDRFVYINGQKVFFKGVNRQDTHPLTGRTMDTESLLTDVKLFKQYNINTVRTSHCPHQPKMMAMYDHFGIYVMDEADLETHAIDWKLVDDPTWTAAYVDRQERMVLRDRNHPSVIFWSLGNESRNGSNFYACREAIRELDPRMVHYEGQQADGFPNSDFTSKMYPYENDVVRMDNWDDERPHFVCEYAHSMGQSLGNFADYWDYFENSKRTIGGCIWDWADQAIYHPAEIKNGSYKKGRWYTGYDFPGPHQGNFMSNGVVDPERNISQKLIEVKKVHQWITVKGYNAKTNRITVENKYNFLNLAEFDVRWTLSRDGVDVQTATVAMENAAPGSTAIFVPEFTAIDADDNAEYLLTLEFLTKKATDWASAGHVVASEQITIKERPALPEYDLDALDQNLVTTGNGPVTVSGKGFAYTIDANGSLISIKVNGHELIHNGKGLAFDDFRWIENDSPYTGTAPKSYAPQSVPNTNLLCHFTDGDANGAKAVKLISVNERPGTVKVITTYVIYSNGVIDVKNAYTAYTGNLNRLGMSMSLVPGLEQIEYFARGPWSNYIDRKTGSFAAVYNTTVTDMAEHFVKPQSSGNREELRYLKITSPKDGGFGLMIEAQGPTSFSALHYNEEDLGTALHDFELTPREETILHLDRFQQGIGNGSCGSTIWARYTTPVNQEMKHTLRITPLVSESMGYIVPEGTAGAYLKSLSGNNFEMKANKAPETLYQLLGKSLIVVAGSTATLEAVASETVNIAAWIDADKNAEFADEEKLSVGTDGRIAVVVPASMTPGTYRMRLVLDSASPKADGPVASGRVYDIVVNVVADADAPVAEYIIPDGSLHSQKKAYLRSITTSGADEDIEFSASSCPKKVYTLVDGTIRATSGSSFDLNMVANPAGPRSTTSAYQDLRYNYAVIFADYTNSGKFTEIARIGSEFQGQNILANYDVIMNISHRINLPAGLPGGHGRLRVIFQNAWRGLTDANEQNILEGVAYDIPMLISAFEPSDEPSTLPSRVEGHPDGTVHPEGNAYVKRIVSTGALSNIDVRWDSQPGFYTLLDEEIVARPGTDFSFRMIANRLGASGKILQDLRYNHATLFVDWEGLGLFERLTRVGDIMKDENIAANYEKLMSFTVHVSVPEDIDNDRAIIRVIYENAWRPEPGPYAQEITEGCAYDIPVRIDGKNNSGIEEISLETVREGIFDLHGHRLLKVTTPGIYIIDGVKTAIR